MLSQYANIAAYSAIVVLAAAMIAFVVDLARSTSRQTSATTRDGAPAPVPAAATASHTIHAIGPTAVALSPAAAPSTPAAPRQAAGIGTSLTWLGAVLLVAAAVMRGAAVSRVPWGNMFEFSLTGSAAVTVTYLVLSLRRDVRWLGTFVVGPVVLTLGLAVTVFYTEASPLLPSLRSFWLVIHVSIAILAVALFTLAAAVTVLQMIQDRREKAASQGRSFMRALPNAAALDRLGHGLHVAAFPLWTFTLIAGAIWAQKAWGAYWQWDPKEVWTFVIWVVYAAYLHARATSGWSTRSSNIIALAGYGCIIINYTVVNMYFVGMHSYSGM
ncbi:c-type cytochrome biogenesis protein CcsB [Pedococcus dokdonensis]|nr:c-type cytochrome biogenesis protein CcsB [Pedococcus dokdonensis]